MMMHSKILLLSSALILTGCEHFQTKDPLPGERVSYLDMAGLNLQPDPQLRGHVVTLPKPRALNDFPQAATNFDASFAPYAVDTKRFNTENFDPAWKTSIGASYDNELMSLSHPVFDGNFIFASDGDGRISALSVKDGSILWTKDTLSPEQRDNLLPANIAYGDGKIFATNAAGELLCLDAGNGALLWSQKTHAPSRVMPAIKDGRVFIITIDGRTYAYQADNGKPLWDHQGLSDITNIFGGASPLIKDDLVVVTYSSGEIFALKVDTGAIVWSETMTTSLRTDSISSIPHIVGNPLIEGNILYVTSHGGKTVAYDLTTGLTLWQQDIGSVKSPLLLGNYFFVLESRNRLVCMDKTNGRIYWIAMLPLGKDEKPMQWSSPLAVNDMLVFAGHDGRVVLVSPQNGHILKTLDRRDSFFTQPIVVGQKLLYTTSSGSLTLN